jgi:intein-encoded DNA endonuclease-like protein
VTCDTDAERAVVKAMREHAAHGFGEIRIVFNDGNVDVQEGKRHRFKKKP